MKRSPFLQPLSREHHGALSLAKACERAAASGDVEHVRQACERVRREYPQALEPHFQEEERTLLPLLRDTPGAPLAARTLADHQTLRGLVEALSGNDASTLGRFGRSLAAHVRFEEHELFPALEALR